jgi:crossover junction endodeoxyribonuclease RusA
MSIHNQDSGGELRVELPWPSKSLSPNARVHWRQKSSAARVARETAWAHTLSALRGSRPKGWKGAVLLWQFCPPSRRRYDLDNLIAQHKAAQDGIADALGCDDSKFTTTYSMGQPVKGGAVHVTVRSA